MVNKENGVIKLTQLLGSVCVLSDYKRQMYTYAYLFFSNPTQIEARTVLGHIPAQSTGDTFQNFSPGVGLVCRNSHQHLYICKDYEVRYLCNVNGEPGLISVVPYT